MPRGEFSAQEVLTIAKEMEEEGLAFYKAVAGHVTDPDAKALFLKLASDEVRHVRDIERLGGRAEAYCPSEHDSLVAQYVQGAVDTKVFPPLSKVPEIAASARGVAKAIDFGIGSEKRAMDFYARAKSESRSAEAGEMFGRLYAEEEEHLRLLTALRRNYD
jgi:rubrerythrin